MFASPTLKPTLGKGIFTPSDIAGFLKLPTSTVNRWMKTYWDGEFAEISNHPASWKVEGSKAVDFLTMIEIVVMGSLVEHGVRTRLIVNAHNLLTNKFNTKYPFATKEVLNKIRTGAGKLYWEEDNLLINLDGSGQINLDFIRKLVRNLDFDSDDLASRYWPLGKERSILVDPKRKFGHPVLAGKNIYPETIFNMIKAGDPKEFVADLYELSTQEIDDIIEYCSAA
jgi:uncharacterized protein (DUF433 family)